MTLVELMVALAIMALLLTLTRLALDGVSAEWRLRAAAHQVENVVRWAQNAAVTEARPVQVLYNVPAGSWCVRIGDETFTLQKLPGGVSFESVRFSTGLDVFQDVAAVGVFPDGTLDSHEVNLLGPSKERVRIAFDRLTGEAEYEEGSSASR